MATADSLSTSARILAVLRHLGIEQAHMAVRDARDWQSLVTAYPERIASLTLVCPQGMDPGLLGPLASRLLVFASDQGRPAEMAQRMVASLPEASLVTLRDYVPTTPYIDVAADRCDDIGAGLLAFLARMAQQHRLADVTLGADEGEIDGISYRTQGRGAPLVLFPLSVAPSQWEPLLARLSERYYTVVLGGDALGMVGSLEARGHTAGYLRVVWNLLEAAQLQPGETLLEVGCGTGVLDRWVAQRTGRANRISAVDINPFLLREAAALARREGLADIIEFHQGSAEALPFPEHYFDVTMSSTVIQRVDADRKLAEMARVTKPGGRVAVVGHAHDMPLWVNLPLRAELKAKIEAPGWESTVGHERGCDDASLYRRFHQAGLKQIRMFPQFAAFDDAARLQTMQTTILPTLSVAEMREWHEAVALAQAEGTFFIANPFHCAVGTKP